MFCPYVNFSRVFSSSASGAAKNNDTSSDDSKDAEEEESCVCKKEPVHNITALMEAKNVTALIAKSEANEVKDRCNKSIVYGLLFHDIKSRSKVTLEEGAQR